MQAPDPLRDRGVDVALERPVVASTVRTGTCRSTGGVSDVSSCGERFSALGGTPRVRPAR